MTDKLQYGQIRITQPYLGHIKVVVFRGINVLCTHILPKSLFREPDPILVEVIKKEICNVITDNEKMRSDILKKILSSVKFDGAPLVYNNQEVCVTVKK